MPFPCVCMIQSALEAELGDTTLGASFEHSNGHNSELDIDTNLVKYLLESHSLAMEQQHTKGQRLVPGPAAQLLSQLEISLPAPPPPMMAKKSKK